MFVDPYVGIGGKNSNHWRGGPLSSETGVCEDVLYGSSQVLTAALKTKCDVSDTPSSAHMPCQQSCQFISIRDAGHGPE